MKIGFIGLGNMGASLAKAVLQAKTGAQILLANRSQAKVDDFLANFGGQASSNEEIFAEADVIFLGVKPCSVFLNCFLNTRLSLKKEQVFF